MCRSRRARGVGGSSSSLSASRTDSSYGELDPPHVVFRRAAVLLDKRGRIQPATRGPNEITKTAKIGNANLSLANFIQATD